MLGCNSDEYLSTHWRFDRCLALSRARGMSFQVCPQDNVADDTGKKVGCLTDGKSAVYLGWKLGNPDVLAVQGRGQYWLVRSMGLPKKDPRTLSTMSTSDLDPLFPKTTKRSPAHAKECFCCKRWTACTSSKATRSSGMPLSLHRALQAWKCSAMHVRLTLTDLRANHCRE